MRQACRISLLLLLALACRKAEPLAPDVAAQIGEQEVRYSEFEEYMKRTADDSDGVLGSDVLSQLFDQFLDEKVLVRMAADRKLLPSGGGPREAMDALLRDLDKSEPTDQEISAWYEAHRQDFVRPERVRLRQILTEDRASAERALQEIMAGADFADVAKRLSKDPSAATGGYQGELSRDNLPPAFADVIFALQPGEVSKVVPADYGFHVFQVLEHIPAGSVPLEEARDEIRERLREQRADRLLADLVREGRKQYNVVVHRRNLPFNYQGSYL
ncbi:MAG TPA: peptidylprolyl isomerase [Thermoanaerobaculia bacterium]|nr:peptidylprolyl isomerase [Thermoanaerobaculia bacterium]